ncbi:magnesium chelatase [Mobiluncus curtisii]|nr:magnesium chelatase [Mobiluncus curtisii]NMW44822.1 magnesium chelatase [Mobiluncus curtisii]NMW47066.1 magnesium chelatase [Mobiluncus curtisii]
MVAKLPAQALLPARPRLVPRRQTGLVTPDLAHLIRVRLTQTVPATVLRATPVPAIFPTTAQTMAPRAREATPEVQIPPDRHGCGPPTGSSAEFVQELPHA